MKAVKTATLVAAACLCGASALADGLVQNGGFETLDKNGKPAGWALSGDFKVEKGEGQNGSVGLVFESSTPSKANSVARQVIEGIHRGDTVRLTALVKREGYFCKEYGAHVTLEQRDAKGNWLGAVYARTDGKPEDGTWALRTGGRLVPTNAVDYRLCIIVAKGSTGRVSFDNIAIERVGAKPVQFVTTDAYRDTAAGGRVRVLASLEVPESSQGRAVARFSWTDSARKRVSAAAEYLTVDSATITLDVAALAMGQQTIALSLTDGDKLLGEGEVTFTRVSALPKRRVDIDPKGRCIFDGKPFFPIGIYAYPKPASLKLLADSPFNTVLHYKLLKRSELDEIASYGLKTFSALDRKLSEQALADRIDAIKDHPALFAWYIGDELQTIDIPDQTRLYRLLRSHDPDHPVYAVQDRIYDLRPFMQTADVLGLDPYPVAQRPIRMVTDFIREGRATTFDARPHWSVPQMFNWALHRPLQRDRERYPTEAELRSIAWQHIAGGANGLVAYKLHHEKPEEWEWAKKVYGEIADRAETLVSDEPAPQLVSSSPDVACRAWVKGGRLYLVACNILDKPQKASVRVGAPFNQTVDLDLAPIEVRWIPAVACQR